MIRYADSPALEKKLNAVLAGEDLLHACLLAAYRSARAPGADFWVCESGKVPYGALLRANGGFIFCSGEKPNLTELGEFLRFMGCRRLAARLPVLEPLAASLGLAPPRHAPIMALQANVPLPCFPTGGEPIEIRREREQLRPIYALLGECDADFGTGGSVRYEDWLSGMRLRERDGICGIWALYAGGQLAATASVMAASGRCAEIGALATRRELRGRGYGSLLLCHLSQRIRQGGRQPILACAQDSLARYYRRLGFDSFDRWAIAEREQ